MLEFLTATNHDDAFAIIKNDHDKVKSLFKQFEKADNLRTKKKIAAEAIMELKIHAEIEEKIFYPSVRKGVKKNLMNEADEEHHVAKMLIAELEQMNPSDEHWEAKFTVLAENIRHHIKEEEGEMIPQARKLDLDFNVLGRKLLTMKQQLKINGVPACDEEKLIARNTKVDSPAKASKNKLSLAVSRTRIKNQKKEKRPASIVATRKKTAIRRNG
jgi:hypothetical protein